MEQIEIKTLVDITRPEVYRPGQGSLLEQNQYKNWITLQQCIGLRSIIEFDTPPVSEKIDIKGMGFGNKYKGHHQVWTFIFRPDRTLAYDDQNGNPIGLLLSDIDQVPIIQNLTETINISKAVFDLDSPQYKNIIVKVLDTVEDTN
jgi:hypothetical protein